MLKALVTGIDGFTGRYLAAELSGMGYDVIGLARHEPEVAIPYAAAVHACDLCDSDGLAAIVREVQPDVVGHLAAIAFVAHGDVDAIYRTNVVGSRNLLQALVQAPTRVRSVLMASSANVYGNAAEGELDESTPPAPANDYAVSKLAMEYMAKLYQDHLPITIVRPFNYTGVGQSPNFLLPKIVDHFRARAPLLELGNLHVVRDFSDVRMVTQAYARLMHGEFAGEVFNVCSSVGYALREVLSMMESITDYKPEIRVNPAFLRANEVHKLIGNCGKLQRSIGCLPRIPLESTLRWMLENPA